LRLAPRGKTGTLGHMSYALSAEIVSLRTLVFALVPVGGYVGELCKPQL
jgi:hypothetical protein